MIVNSSWFIRPGGPSMITASRISPHEGLTNGATVIWALMSVGWWWCKFPNNLTGQSVTWNRSSLLSVSHREQWRGLWICHCFVHRYDLLCLVDAVRLEDFNDLFRMPLSKLRPPNCFLTTEFVVECFTIIIATWLMDMDMNYIILIVRPSSWILPGKSSMRVLYYTTTILRSVAVVLLEEYYGMVMMKATFPVTNVALRMLR